MIQRIQNALKTKFEGVSDFILSRVAEKLAKNATTPEQADEVVKNYTLSQLVEGEADRRANEAQQSAVKNYETKWNIKDGKPVANGKETDETNTKPEPTKDGEEFPAWAKELREQNKMLAESLANMTKARLTEGRKAKLASVIEKLPASLKKGYERTSLEGTDEEFASLISTISTEVDGILQDTKQRGVVFGQPKQGANGDTSKLTDEQIKAIANKQSQSADAQPF